MGHISHSFDKRMPTQAVCRRHSYRATDEELRQLFSQAGEVSSVFIPMDRETNRPRGFAFVEMADDAAADKGSRCSTASQTWAGRRIAGQQEPVRWKERAPRGNRF